MRLVWLVPAPSFLKARHGQSKASIRTRAPALANLNLVGLATRDGRERSLGEDDAACRSGHGGVAGCAGAIRLRRDERRFLDHGLCRSGDLRTLRLQTARTRAQ